MLQKRKTLVSPDNGQQSQKLQRTLSPELFASSCRGPVQEFANNLITDYIIQDLQPFSKTEGLGFRKLINGLTPVRATITRKNCNGAHQYSYSGDVLKAYVNTAATKLCCNDH
jgi:hypothetical protein